MYIKRQQHDDIYTDYEIEVTPEFMKTLNTYLRDVYQLRTIDGKQITVNERHINECFVMEGEEDPSLNPEVYGRFPGCDRQTTHLLLIINDALDELLRASKPTNTRTEPNEWTTWLE